MEIFPDQAPSVGQLADVLREGAYTQQRLVDLSQPMDARGRIDPAILRRRLVSTQPEDLLVLVFLAGEFVPSALLDKILGNALACQLRAAGILCDGPLGSRSTLRITPFNDIFVAHDFPSRLAARSDPLHQVPGIGPASLTLADHTIRRHARTATDLGTGCGIQALLAARHSDRVIATDTNPRALALAALNSALNRLGNVEPRAGSFFDPLQGDSLDLLVANPPFVISPRQEYIFRDAGWQGDGVSEYVVRNAPARLADDGWAVMLINWCHNTEKDWASRPQEWLEGSGCDAWLLCHGSRDVLTYAARWLHSDDDLDEASFEDHLDSWIQYYAKHGIRRIAAGTIILRKRPKGQNWFRGDRVEAGKNRTASGDFITNIFSAETFLRGQDALHALKSRRLRIANDHVMRQTFTLSESKWMIEQTEIEHRSGLNWSGRADELTLSFLEQISAHGNLGLAIRAVMAASKNNDVEEGMFLDAAVALLRAGFLELVD